MSVPYLSQATLNKIDTANIFKTQDNFLKEILLIWSEINFEECITSASQFSEQSLWYNSLIRINDNSIFYKEWYRKGIIKVKHLRNRDENFLTLAEFQNKYNIKVQPLVYCGIISALKTLWKTINLRDHSNESNGYESYSTKVLKAKKQAEWRMTSQLRRKVPPLLLASRNGLKTVI